MVVKSNRPITISCPIPEDGYPEILLGHGGGGLLTKRLIENLFKPAFNNPLLSQDHDGAVLSANRDRIAVTTDSYVVSPLFFPGGDIGTLAVNGSINDLAMCGARPLCLSAAFILEEGLAMHMLWQIVRSMKEAAEASGVQIVTGDTKVVSRGKGDGIFITTTGIGAIDHDLVIAPSQVYPGDVLLLSGDLGRHGMAVLSKREGLEFESTIESDCAPLWKQVSSLLEAEIEVHCMRDLTRGGLATALVEIAGTRGIDVVIEEKQITVRDEVRGACEIMGLDPLYVANEGCMIAFVSSKHANRALQILREFNPDASIIGLVEKESAGLVTLKNTFGTSRVIDMLSGEQLPRIC